VHEGFDPGALLARSYELAGRQRVVLRLARLGDLRGLEALCDRLGVSLGELELARLLRSNPRERLVICAMALKRSAEVVVGLGVIEIDHVERGPSLLLVDEDLSEGVGELLSDALTGRAHALTRARAA
jgi:hypothetical protein